MRADVLGSLRFRGLAHHPRPVLDQSVAPLPLDLTTITALSYTNDTTLRRLAG